MFVEIMPYVADAAVDADATLYSMLFFDDFMTPRACLTIFA